MHGGKSRRARAASVGGAQRAGRDAWRQSCCVRELHLSMTQNARGVMLGGKAAARELHLSAARNARERDEDIFQRRHGGEWVKRCGRKPSLEQTPVKLPDAAANGIAATYPGTKQALASQRAPRQASSPTRQRAPRQPPAEHRQDSERRRPGRTSTSRRAPRQPPGRTSTSRRARRPGTSTRQQAPRQPPGRTSASRRARRPGRISTSQRAPRQASWQNIDKASERRAKPPRHIDKTASAAGAWLRGACPHCGGSYFFFFGLAASSSA